MASANQAPFSLPTLSYSYDALEDVIDAKTMETHHSKHHQAYINNLNAEVAKDTALEGKSLEEILGSISGSSTAVRNNAGGHWNHTFFWQIIAPESQGDQPSAQLAAAIRKHFGSMDEFKAAFEKAGAGQLARAGCGLLLRKMERFRSPLPPTKTTR